MSEEAGAAHSKLAVCLIEFGDAGRRIATPAWVPGSDRNGALFLVGILPGGQVQRELTRLLQVTLLDRQSPTDEL